jgi:hypothetical protein
MLVEPVKHDLPNVALMKISTMHKSKGDNVKFYYGAPSNLITFKPDVIYVSTIFTWEFRDCIMCIRQLKKNFPDAKLRVGGISASLQSGNFKLNAELIEEELHVGLWDELDNIKPDYSLFPDIDYSIVMSSRGCVNKCAFCMVSKLEPNYYENKYWWKSIDGSKPKIVFFDNNFFASTREHFDNVMDMLEILDKDVDFNQGLDSRIFYKSEYIAQRMSKINIHPLRFAWDGKQEDIAVPEAIKLAFKYHLSDISVYMLYNFHDTPEEIYYRMKTMAGVECNGHRGNSVYIFPMKYQPLDTLEKSNFVGEHWTEKTLYNFNQMRNTEFVNGILRFNNVAHVEKVFGKDEKEFLDRLNREEAVDRRVDWRAFLKNSNNSKEVVV